MGGGLSVRRQKGRPTSRHKRHLRNIRLQGWGLTSSRCCAETTATGWEADRQLFGENLQKRTLQ